MSNRWRVSRVIFLSTLLAAATTLVLAFPLVSVMGSLHVGCTLYSDGQYTDYICPDGVGYVIPVLMLATVTFDIFLLIGLYRNFRAQPLTIRRRAATFVERLLAFVLIGQALIAIPQSRLGGYSPTATWGSLVLVVAGAVVLASSRMSVPAHAATMTVISVGLVGIAGPVFLLAPIILVIAALPLLAVLLRARSPSGAQRPSPGPAPV